MKLQYRFSSFFSSVVLIISLCSTPVLSQERISEIITNGTGQRQILKQYNGENYILTIDQFDSLKVYKYEEGESIFLHSRKYIALNDEVNFTTTDQFLLHESTEGSIAYNYITDEELLFPYEDSLNYTYWSQLYKDEVVLRQSSLDFNQKKQMLINLVTGEETLIDNKYTAVGNIEHSLLLRECIPGEDCYMYTYDKEDASLDSLARVRPYTNNNYFDDEIFVYLNDNKVERYNRVTGIRDVIHLENSELIGFRIFGTANHFVMSFRLNNTPYFMVINKASLNLTTIQKSVSLKNVLYDEPSNKIIFGEYNDVFIYHINSGTLEEFETWLTFPALAVLDNKYLFYAFDLTYKLHDLVTGDDHDLGIPYQNGGVNYKSIVKTEDGYLVNLDYSTEDFEPLWHIDTENKTMSSAMDIVPTMRAGLQRRGYVVKVGDEIIIVEKDIHKVVEDEIVQLNIGNIVESEYEPIKISNGDLYWVENVNTSVILCSILEGERIEIVTLPQTLPLHYFQNTEEYEVTDNYVYFIKGDFFIDKELIRINRETGDEEKILNAAGFGIDDLFSHNNHAYYIDESIYAINDPGEVNSLDINLGFFLFGQYAVFKNEMFYKTDSIVYKIAGNESENVLKTESDFLNVPYIFGDYLFVQQNPQARYFSYTQDGEVWMDLETPDDHSVSFLQNGYIAFMKNVETNRFETTLYHLPTGKTINIPDEFKELRYSFIIEQDENTIALATQGFFPNLKVHVIQLDNDPNEIISIGEFDSSGRGLKSSFDQYENEGFLYSGTRLFLMNEELEFISLSPEVAGDSESVNSVEKDGYFHFIGFHPTLGRQVYRVQVFSERLVETTKDFEVQDVVVSPNPASESISLKNISLIENWNYTLFSFDGKKMKEGRYDQTISVSDLKQGPYILVLQNTVGKILLGKFVKI